jgi:hypothetical protein
MRTKLITLFATLFAIGGLYAAKPARADGQPEVSLAVKAPEPSDPKTKDLAPTIEATVVGGPTVPQDKFTLTEPGAKPPISIKASALRPYATGPEKVAVAIVMNGQEVWIGNDEIETEDSPARHLGILKNLKQALQTVQLASAIPSDAKGVLISYHDKAEVKIAMGPLANINSEALGNQKDYYKKLGTAMSEGINLAMSELQNVTASQKALIVICDGTDSKDPAAAKNELTNLKKRALNQKIQTFAILYKGELTDGPSVIGAFTNNVTSATNAEGIASNLQSILSQMANRYYLTFPGFDSKLGVGFNWDGKAHDLVVKIDKDDTEPFTLTLAPVWQPAKKGGFPWLVIVLVVVGVLLLIIIGAKVFGKKEAPMPMAMPMPMVAAPAAEAPKPAGPMKTVMIGAGGDQDGFPIVGWLVPLNGPDAYKTWKLRSGGTKIGTAPPADLVVNDGFMSTEHCLINCSPAGFMLVDGGSTNGCYVNDKKVSKHDLVDNDTITLGKTNFKFKSIS